MLHLKLKVAVEGVDETFVSGKSLESGWSDEIACISGHDNMDISMLLYQHRSKIGYLVCGYASGHSEYYGLVFQHIVALVK